MELQKRHPFSFTLGPGPYRYVGYGAIHTSETFGARYSGPPLDAGAGTCQHCGHAIMNIYIVQTGEGKRLGVGSDCIEKVYVAGEFDNLSAFECELRKRRREKARAQRESKSLSIEKEVKAVAFANGDVLATIPHPNEYRAKQGDTFQSYADWYFSKQHTLGGWKLFKKDLLEVLNGQSEKRP